MRWKDAFDVAMKELEGIRAQLARLDDPTVGLTALHGELIQGRLKMLETIQGGVTGLREENRELRRRQERMISDLNETRGELGQLLDLVEGIRLRALPDAAAEEAGGTAQPEPEQSAAPPEPAVEADDTPSGSVAAYPVVSSTTESQGGTMDNIERRPQSSTDGQDQNAVLRRDIEAAHRDVGTSTAFAAQPAAAVPQVPEGGIDPRVAHGVLLLKAAGVASAELIAHRDTWEWLAALAVGHSHFRTPPAVEDFKEGRVRTVLSGRSLIALLIELWNTRSTAAPLGGDWSLAMTSYQRIAAELTDITGQGDVIRIVLDDGLPSQEMDD